jgi:hypothetical protein
LDDNKPQYIEDMLQRSFKYVDTATEKDVESMIIIATVLLRPRFRNTQRAIKYLEHAVRICPTNFISTVLLLSCYFDQGFTHNLHQAGELLLNSD